mmetsp:Transcript_22367/g.52920  ORF Transcript_22367/g.52920 Transcript_22367/m.52920 type:complete len:247 (-) Transcript_22367:153-893(-)
MAARKSHRRVLRRKRVEDSVGEKPRQCRVLLFRREGMSERGGRERKVEGQPRHAAHHGLALQRGECRPVRKGVQLHAVQRTRGGDRARGVSPVLVLRLRVSTGAIRHLLLRPQVPRRSDPGPRVPDVTNSLRGHAKVGRDQLALDHAPSPQGGPFSKLRTHRVNFSRLFRSQLLTLRARMLERPRGRLALRHLDPGGTESCLDSQLRVTALAGRLPAVIFVGMASRRLLGSGQHLEGLGKAVVRGV